MSRYTCLTKRITATNTNTPEKITIAGKTVTTTLNIVTPDLGL